ncbi:E3 ubiquitin-protein ligase UHRF1 [Araneus ventricosus]|uniref:E3 ubiquitin-protein ligase UHRF1 n=1 Tax=Araneus ventricosus TaxID=182803 RepID=A0A4Y2GD26_ARAVE|nr:E3 ubiquitin-protein ligase UHRF1 [Araneus ventricosus]
MVVKLFSGIPNFKAISFSLRLYPPHDDLNFFLGCSSTFVLTFSSYRRTEITSTSLINNLENGRLVQRHGAAALKQQEVKPKYRRVKGEFGAIPGVPVGTIFSTRMEASLAGIHRDKLSVIHGNQWGGCYSLILSGASLSVEDLGESFICTEEDGRNRRGKNSKMQLSKALSKNMKNNHPVRVLRGPYLKSKFAAKWGRGYRYDGLYKVVEYSSQSKVYRFRFERIKDQEPAPWIKDFIMLEASENTLSEKENVPKEDQLQNENSKFRILEEEDILEEESET